MSLYLAECSLLRAV